MLKPGLFEANKHQYTHNPRPTSYPIEWFVILQNVGPLAFSMALQKL